MIEYRQGDILKEDAEALINTVNCVGVMGRGIALQFKNAFPENFRAYAKACKREEVQPGRMFVYPTGYVTNPHYIINFPTKRHWRGKSRKEDIRSGLQALIQIIREYGLKSVAVPPLGSGLGGLDWEEVRTWIEEALAPLEDVQVLVYEPNGSPGAGEITRSRSAPNMTQGRAALIELMDRYLAGLLDPFVTLLEVHKLLYFMQAAGEPLRLEFHKGHYGPYAANLRHVLRAVEGYYLAGYADGGDAPDKQLTLVPGAIEEARALLETHPETRSRFQRVADLVEGFESPFGLELLATVHWLMTHDEPRDLDALVGLTHTWGPQKAQFTPRQIGIAVGVLEDKGWVAPGLAR